MRILYLLYFIAVFILSIIFHEVAHGFVALKFGDPTAKNAGRLTLNPLPHIDPFGSIILPGFLIFIQALFGFGIIIGWAKPVPIDPLRFSNFRIGTFMVSIAGVAINFFIAITVGLVIRFFIQYMDAFDFLVLYPFVLANLALGFLNLLPIPPLDGSKVLAAILGLSFEQQAKFEQFGIHIALFLLIFITFVAPNALMAAMQGLITIFEFITGIPLPFK